MRKVQQPTSIYFRCRLCQHKRRKLKLIELYGVLCGFRFDEQIVQKIYKKIIFSI